MYRIRLLVELIIAFVAFIISPSLPMRKNVNAARTKTNFYRLTYLACLAAAEGLQIFKYTVPLISIKEGKAWIVNGNFNLVHMINLDGFERQLAEVSNTIEKNMKDGDGKQLIDFHLAQVTDRIRSLKREPHRKPRSIDWIGSAWKWVAGNPDAADWDKIVGSQQQIVANNNHQYKINDKLFNVVGDIATKINRIIDKENNEIRVADIQKLEQRVLSQVLTIKGEINEIVRACQMAKSGIINTNLLDHDEINLLVNELEFLPYGNEIEAIEFATPSIYTNGSMLLYTLSIPKVTKEDYNLLLTKPSIMNEKQVSIEFDRVLVNQKSTYGMLKNCLSISNSTICKEEALEKIPEDHCMSRLLKGGHATCTYRTNTDEIMELIENDTIFLTNFNGELTSGNSTQMLEGTFIIKLNNETIRLKNRTFTSSCTTMLRALPPVLSEITSGGHRVDLQFVHNLSLQNIERLGNLARRVKVSTLSDGLIIMLLATIAYILWRKISGRLNLPAVRSSEGTSAVTQN